MPHGTGPLRLISILHIFKWRRVYDLGYVRLLGNTPQLGGGQFPRSALAVSQLLYSQIGPFRFPGSEAPFDQPGAAWVGCLGHVVTSSHGAKVALERRGWQSTPGVWGHLLARQLGELRG